MLMGLYNTASSKPWLALMVTTEIEALRELADSRPELLIVTEPLEQGSGLALVIRARELVSDVRTILIRAGPPRWFGDRCPTHTQGAAA